MGISQVRNARGDAAGGLEPPVKMDGRGTCVIVIRMARRKVSNELWAALEPLIPELASGASCTCRCSLGYANTIRLTGVGQYRRSQRRQPPARLGNWPKPNGSRKIGQQTANCGRRKGRSVGHHGHRGKPTRFHSIREHTRCYPGRAWLGPATEETPGQTAC